MYHEEAKTYLETLPKTDYSDFSTQELIEKIEDLEYEVTNLEAFIFFFKSFTISLSVVIIFLAGVLLKLYLE